MKILFVNQFYWPEVAATAHLLSDLAEHLAQEGHDVHVLCSSGGYDSAAVNMRPRREVHAGVHIHRLSGPNFGKRTTLGRVIDYAAFHVLCGLRLVCIAWRFRLVVTLTSPPLIGIYGTLARWVTFGRTRHVCWSMDLHPDCEFELGIWSRRHPVWALLGILNDSHFRQADATVAIGRCMHRRLGHKRVRVDRLHVIGVWSRSGIEARTTAIAPPIDTPAAAAPRTCGPRELRSRLGWDGRFVIMYGGNAGLIHTFDAVCEAMLSLDRDSELLFAFVGGGRRLCEVAGFAGRHGLRNFAHLPYVDREEYEAHVAAADVHLVTLRPGLEGVAVPSKLYGIMAARKPVIYVGPMESDAARAIAEADCGRVIGSHDAPALAAAIRQLAADPAERTRLGDNGRRYFEEHHERTHCCEQWSRLLEDVAQKKAA